MTSLPTVEANMVITDVLKAKKITYNQTDMKDIKVIIHSVMTSCNYATTMC